jgi:hypothetical protein
MAAGHTVTARDEWAGQPVRRSAYEGGTVSYDVTEHGVPVRLTIRPSGQVRVHFPDRVMLVDGLRHSPTGWTNVELVRRPS